MAIVFVIPGVPSGKLASELAERVVLCGCEVALTDHSLPLGIDEIEAGIARSDVLLVVVAATLDASTASAVEIATRRGKRICAVWPPEATAEELPDEITNLADALLAWDSVNFCKVVCEGEAVSEGIDGGPSPVLQNPHHRC